MPKRKSYTVAFKIEVINWHMANGGFIKKTAREFEIDRKRVREWLQNEEELRQHLRGKAAKRRRLQLGKPMSEDLDFSVLEYLEEERAKGLPVCNDDLKAKGRLVAREMGMNDFKASDGWLRRWKKRNFVGIRRGTNEAQKIPEDYADKISEFQREIIAKRREHDYADHAIGNMDQTMARFDMAPSTTNNVRNERNIRIATGGGSKKGFTVALAARADGTKLPAYCVLKEPSGRIPPRVMANLVVPHNIRLAASKNGWMTGELMQDWVQRCWGGNQDDVRRLLILDQARIHTMPATVEKIAEKDTDVVFIPGGCTPIAQPADVSWNKPFKAAMRREWRAWRSRDERTPQGNLKVC